MNILLDYKNIFTLVSVIIALILIFLGIQMYKNGIGTSSDNSNIKINLGKFKVEASFKTVGALLILTSLIWGFLGFIAMPKSNFEKVYQYGFIEGVKKGTKNSQISYIIDFLDDYKILLDTLSTNIQNYNKQNKDSIKAKIIIDSNILVENVIKWREIRDDLKELLNGRVDGIQQGITEKDINKIAENIRILEGSFKNRRLSIILKLNEYSDISARQEAIQYLTTDSLTNLRKALLYKYLKGNNQNNISIIDKPYSDTIKIYNK